MSDALRVGTRRSPLALAQTELALARLRQAHPDVPFESVEIQTHGDEDYRRDLDTPLDGKRAFTKRIDDALLRGEIDVAVHSLKDVPATLTPGLRIAAILTRADPRDAFVANDALSLGYLPRGTRIGTSSLRRRAQLLAEWPLLDVIELRGNVGTRLRRLEAKDFDAIVVAAAGLERLHVTERRVQPISPGIVTPAPGQGALALECRDSDAGTLDLLRSIEDPIARRATDAERMLSARLGGGCNVPFGALATIQEGSLHLQAVVASADGRRVIRAEAQGPAETWEATVDAVGARLLEGGAKEILKETG